MRRTTMDLPAISPKKNWKRHTLCLGEIQNLDRFIPHRAKRNNSYSHFLLKQAEKKTEEDEKSSILYQKINELKSEAYRTLLNRAFNITDSSIVSIIPPKNEAKRMPRTLWPAFPRSKPCIGSPIIILNMLTLNEHLDVNLVDWSTSDYITLALDAEVYMRHSCTGDMREICLPSRCTAVKWNLDGCQLAIGMSNGYLWIWNLATDKVMHKTCLLKSCLVTAIEWHSTEDYLITGCTDGSIRIYSHGLCLQQSIPSTHTRQIITLAFNCDGTYLASSSMDGFFSVFLWKDLATQACLKVSLGSPIRAICWHPWKPFLLCVGSLYGSLNMWDVSQPMLIAKSNPVTKNEDHHHLYCLTFNKISGELVSSHSIQNGRAAEGKPQIQINVLSSFDKVVDLVPRHKKPVLYLKWNADGTQLATAGMDDTLQVWNFLPQQKPKSKKPSGETSSKHNFFLIR